MSDGLLLFVLDDFFAVAWLQSMFLDEVRLER